MVTKKKATPLPHKIQEFINHLENIASKDLKIRKKKSDETDPMHKVLKAIGSFKDEVKTLQSNKDQAKKVSTESAQILNSLLKHTPTGIAVLEGPEFRYLIVKLQHLKNRKFLCLYDKNRDYGIFSPLQGLFSLQSTSGFCFGEYLFGRC